jgi:hypothetical protein
MENFSNTDGAIQDNDIDKAGKVIGYDLLSFSFDPKTKTSSVGVTVVANGGFLYGVMPTSGAVIKGKVTGGTGTFQDATGTITATNLNKTGTKTAITITYHT